MKYWTKQEIKDLKENYFYYLDHKEEAEEKFQRNWNSISNNASLKKITSMKINKNCSIFLGCTVAERILSHVFKDVQRMPIRNKGFDFICNKGHKIDSKASCLNDDNIYMFDIKHNKIADYFLLIGFDDRENLNPQHIWLIKGDELMYQVKICRKLSDFESFPISNNYKSLSKLLRYELTDKLKEVITYCDMLKLNS